MAKRISRSRSRSRPSSGPGGETRTARSTLPPASQTELAEQYSYVRRDLARIGIIATALIAGLIVLSFVLPLLIK